MSACHQQTHRPRSDSALKCSRALTSAAAEGKPPGERVLVKRRLIFTIHHHQEEGAVRLFRLLSPASSFSFNAGTHPDIQTLMRTGACRFSAHVASFLPIVKSRRGVNGSNAPLKSTREEGKNGEGACGQQFGKRVSQGGEFPGRCCNLRSRCGSLGTSQHVGCASFNEHLMYPASPP